jgi:hypothetical protein
MWMEGSDSYGKWLLRNSFIYFMFTHLVWRLTLEDTVKSWLIKYFDF